jgi:hypothetical protein
LAKVLAEIPKVLVVLPKLLATIKNVLAAQKIEDIENNKVTVANS